MAAESDKPDYSDQMMGADLVPIYANYMFARVDGASTRLVFGHGLPGVYAPKFHTSLYVETTNAVQFANLILQVVADNNKNLAKIAEAAVAAAEAAKKGS